jgi:succinylarginine dihydrolase
MFPDKKYFAHHLALPSSGTLGDEGAANHTRFCREYGEPGVQLFLYGKIALESAREAVAPKIFPARQTLEASQCIARLHRVNEKHTLYAQQNPAAIDAGAFHNDVVSVGNQNVFFHHEHAFLKTDQLMRDVKKAVEDTCKTEFVAVKVLDKDVPMADAVKSYLFNSQLITLSPGRMCLVAPSECEETPTVARYLSKLLGEAGTPIRDVRYFNLRQSMANGGGPACLRLRVVLTEEELAHVNPHVMMNEKSFARLSAWAEKHYRDRLTPDDLADPKLHEESLAALDELTQIMKLGSIYPFQSV